MVADPRPLIGAAKQRTRPRARTRSGWSPWTAVLVSALFSVLVVFVRPFDVAYRSWTLHVAIETLAAVVCMIAAYLFAGRYRLNGRFDDLILACSLLMLAIGGLCFSLLPAALAGGDITRFSTWAPVVTDLLGAAGFAVAAFTNGRLVLQRRGIAVVAGLFLLVVLIIALAIGLTAAQLPVAISPRLSPVLAGRKLLVGRPSILALQLVSVLLMSVSAWGFWRRRRRERDELLGVLSIAMTIGAFAAFNYFLFPSLYSQWVYSGDILRLAFYVVILIGVARELNGYWRGLARTATFEERRRIARELHDGLAQELAFIANRSKLLPDELARELRSASERALEESRRAIDALTRPLDEGIDVAVMRAAEEVAIRFGVRLALDLEPVIEASASVRDALSRITREAATNAARHGKASHLAVSLASQGSELRLRIADDGRGFHVDGPRRGFGLVSMSERAASVGGTLRVRSQPGAGTVVEAVIP